MRLAEAEEQMAILGAALDGNISRYYGGATLGYVVVHEKDGRRTEFSKVKEVVALFKKPRRKKSG